jgi:hypothetical protein
MFIRFMTRSILTIILFVFLSTNLAARERGGLFPGIFFTDTINAICAGENASPYWARTSAEHETILRKISDYQSLLLNNDILAYYGHPRSRNMGILGRFPIEELYRQLAITASNYEALSGGRGIIKAFYIIYGTAWPEGAIGYINDDLLRQWINFALERNMLIFIDHQIGRFDPIQSAGKLFPWLRYPNVHLALDPEWRTDRPMQVIGHLTAEEINEVQQAMQDYMYENDIPGERFLVIHQFNWRMITRRERVRADFERVRLVHHISGIGTPTEKRATYDLFAQTTNMPVKGFKLWYDFGLTGHTDKPLMTPAEVYALQPRPFIIMYQ